MTIMDAFALSQLHFTNTISREIMQAQYQSNE
jgi:hypothetical protein